MFFYFESHSNNCIIYSYGVPGSSQDPYGTALHQFEPQRSPGYKWTFSLLCFTWSISPPHLGVDSELDLVSFAQGVRDVDLQRGVRLQIHVHGPWLQEDRDQSP